MLVAEGAAGNAQVKKSPSVKLLLGWAGGRGGEKRVELGPDDGLTTSCCVMAALTAWTTEPLAVALVAPPWGVELWRGCDGALRASFFFSLLATWGWDLDILPLQDFPLESLVGHLKAF